MSEKNFILFFGLFCISIKLRISYILDVLFELIELPSQESGSVALWGAKVLEACNCFGEAFAVVVRLLFLSRCST